MSRISRYRPPPSVAEATLSDEQVRKLDWSQEAVGSLRPPRPKPVPPVRSRKGRPKGSPSRWLSAQQRIMAAKTGELPHQFMLRVMRLGSGAKLGNHTLDWEDVKWAATHAAPYYAPRLASLHVKPSEKPPVVVHLDPTKIKDLSPEDLNRMLATLAAAMGLQQQRALPAPDNSEPPIINGEGEIVGVDESLYERTLQ